MAFNTTYELKTFADIYTAVAEELKIQSADTNSINRIKRNINLVYLNEVVPFTRWKWLNGRTDISTELPITSGTANVTQFSNTVTLSVALSPSKQGYWFSADGYQERYRIAQHVAGSATLVLESQFTGNTNTATNYHIWTDHYALPADCRETIQVGQDWIPDPLEARGQIEFNTLVGTAPKAENRPRYYYTGEKTDPTPFVAIQGLPSLTSRASNGLVKTLVFASDVSSYFEPEMEIQVFGSPVASYNGNFIVSSVNTTTITYTGEVSYQESATSDSSLTVYEADAESYVSGARELFIYPAIYTSNPITLHVYYTRQALPLTNDSDEPLMPIEDRAVLLYGALDNSWARERNPEAADRALGKFANKLKKMAGKIEDSLDKPILQPDKTYLSVKRAVRRVREARFNSLEDVGGGGGSSGISPSTPSKAVITDINGNVVASQTVSSTQVGYLATSGSNIHGDSDAATLTNKTIAAGSNTISGITNSNLSGSAAVSNANLASMPNNTVKGNTSGSPGTPSDLALGNVTVPSIMSVSGGSDAVIGSGVSIGLANQNANQVLAGPTSGGAATPSFRALVGADLPAPSASTLGGVESYTAPTHQWINEISTSGVPSSTQPTFTDVSGTAQISQGGTGQTTQTAAFDALSPLTAKGDVIVYSGSHNVREPIGTDGQVMVADSTQANGLKWATLNQGAKNYVTYNNFENNSTTGWSLGNVALTSNFPSGVPTFGSGADSHLEIGIVSSNQLAGSYSLSYDSSAAGGAGLVAGDFLASQAYAIDSEDQAKVLAFKFYYKFISGTGQNFSGTSSNTYGVAIYDVTNSAWIMPTGAWNLVQSSGIGIAQGTFQTPSNITQFRLVLFNANTTSAATTLYLDDFYVGPQALAFGPAVTDWQSFTPSWTATGSNPAIGNGSIAGYYRRVGDSMDVRIDVISGTTTTYGSGSYLFSIPTGYSIDSTKSSSAQEATQFGIAEATSTSTHYTGNVVLYSSTTVWADYGGGAFGSTSPFTPSASTANQKYNLSFKVPITGWSSNTQMSADTDTRVCDFSTAQFNTPTGTLAASFNTVTGWGSAALDTHGGFDGNSTYTIQVSGDYEASAQLEISGTYAAGGAAIVRIYKNGTPLGGGTQYAGSASNNRLQPLASIPPFQAKAGDTIVVKSYTDATSPSYTNNSNGSFFSVRRRSGPAVVAATESVNAYYSASASTSLTTNGTIIQFDTKAFDSHNAFTTGANSRYTAPVSGIYEISVFLNPDGITAGSAGQLAAAQLFKNGVVQQTVAAVSEFSTAAGIQLFMSGTTLIKLVAGDYIDLRTFSTITGTAGSVGGNTTWNWISIKRVGN